MTSLRVFAKAWAAAFAAMLVLDAVWLGLVATDYYASALGDLLRPQPDLLVAVLFYAGYAAGVAYFAVTPALHERSAAAPATTGALLGLFAYGTYDLTNLATLRDWPVGMSLVDMAWGTAVTAAMATAAWLVVRRRP